MVQILFTFEVNDSVGRRLAWVVVQSSMLQAINQPYTVAKENELSTDSAISFLNSRSNTSLNLCTNAHPGSLMIMSRSFEKV